MAGKKKAENQGLSIQRGGERFVLEKSNDHFAVKKRPGLGRGELSATGKADALAHLKYQSSYSTRDVEVYRAEAANLDQAMDLLRKKDPQVEWCSHVYHMPGDSEGLMVPTDMIYVELAEGTDPEKINKVLDEHKLSLTPAGGTDPNAFVLRLTSATTQNPIKIANALAETGYFRLAEPDFSFKVHFEAYRPTDSRFSDQWHLENRGGFALARGADVAAPDAWDHTRGDRNIVVCVMDDGVQIDHPDFSSPGKIVAPFDFGGNDPDPNPQAADDNHGTSCAGVAVADENGTGVVGIAPNCRLMPIRTSGMISDTTIRDLFDYARTHGADVISCSWGVTSSFFTLSTQMTNAIRRAAQEGRNGLGCVVLFAAGNEDRPVNGQKNGTSFRAGFAIHPEVIAVAASNSRDQRSHYSNYGSEIWVCAPSSGAGGRGIVTTDRTGIAGYQSGDITDTFGGTSSATPLAAGICALILSVNPNLTATEVKTILKKTAEKIDAQGGNYNADGHSDLYGWGRVHAARAVAEARNLVAPIPTRERSFERQPALAIPDFHPPGISDTVLVEEHANVLHVSVALNISHTYRGDLKVWLKGPNGAEVLLHDREGRRNDNLVATYTEAEKPGLSGFAGIPANGHWSLHVADLARRDTGTLNQWSLILGLAGGSRQTWSATPGLAIPDNDPTGVVSTLAVDGTGNLKDLALSLDISHTWRGDLRISLETPGGIDATVVARSGENAADIRQIFQASEVPALKALVDAEIPINGTWKLHAVDTASRDVGKINGWGLTLKT